MFISFIVSYIDVRISVVKLITILNILRNKYSINTIIQKETQLILAMLEFGSLHRLYGCTKRLLTL